jgi:hypothetical protein
LAANQGFQFFSQELQMHEGMEERGNFVLGKRSFFLYGFVEYDDITGNTRWTRGFAYRYVSRLKYCEEAGGAAYNYDRHER